MTKEVANYFFFTVVDEIHQAPFFYSRDQIGDFISLGNDQLMYNLN